MRKSISCCAMIVAMMPVASAIAGLDVEFIFPAPPYLSLDDSPFDLLSKGSDFLWEDFEDGLLNSLGLSGSGGEVRFPGNFTDSVDFDDGVLDGFGTAGHDYWTFPPTEGSLARFEFDAEVLGGLPRAVGVVWTDGNFKAVTVFRAYGPDGEILGSMEFTSLDDGLSQGQTAEDRFMGAIYAGGISAIEIRADLGRLELDHVQYGNMIPSPGALALLSLAGVFRRRTRRSR